MIATQLQHPAHNRLALTFGVLAFIVIVYWTSFGSMWVLWQTTDHRHGILVFPISAFLIWRLRHDIASVPIQVDGRGLLILTPLLGIWLVARLAGVQVVEHFVVLALIPAAVSAFAGIEFTRRLLFPLGFLLLATPIGDSLIPVLMVITADISTALLQLSAIPVFRSGQYLSLPGGDFVVADVCSGLRYLVTGFMVSLLFGYLTYSSLGKRAGLVAITIVTLIITNGVRAYIVMAVASATDMALLGGSDHIFFGWVLFGMVMMLIMWVAVRFDENVSVAKAGDDSTIVARASRTALPMIAALGLIMLAITIKPLQADIGDVGTMLAAVIALLMFVFLLGRKQAGSPDDKAVPAGHYGDNPAHNAAIIAVTIAVLLVAPQFVHGIEEAARGGAATEWRTANQPCVQAGEWPNRWRPDFASPDFEHAVSLNCSGEIVNLYTAGYSSALQGRELISSSHHPVPPRWDRYSASGVTGAGSNGRGRKTVVEVVIDSETYRAVVWYWYDIDGRIATNSFHVKLLQVMALAGRRPSGGQIILIETRIDGDLPGARLRLNYVASALMARQDQS